MARQRFIHPGIWCDPSFGALSDMGQLMFIGLFSNADDDGRILAGAAYIKSVVWPHRDMSLTKVKNARDEMLKALPRVMLYEVANVEYITFLKWSDYQKPKYPSPSKLPPPPEKDSRNLPPTFPESSASPPEGFPPRARADLGLGLGKGLGSSSEPNGSSSLAPSARNAKREGFNDVWEAVSMKCGKPTRATRSLRAQIVHDLLDEGATAADVHERHPRLELRWPDLTITDTALRKHWGIALMPLPAGKPLVKSRGESISDRVAASRAATYEMLGLDMNSQNGHDMELEALDG